MRIDQIKAQNTNRQRIASIVIGVQPSQIGQSDPAMLAFLEWEEANSLLGHK